MVTQNRCLWDFPGGAMVKTLCFLCSGHGFNPWLGNQDLTSHVAQPKKKKKIEKKILIK